MDYEAKLQAIVGEGPFDFCDYPTAWGIQRLYGLENHKDERCSAVYAQGGFLCDCGTVTDEWAKGMNLLGRVGFKEY